MKKSIKIPTGNGFYEVFPDGNVVMDLKWPYMEGQEIKESSIIVNIGNISVDGFVAIKEGASIQIFFKDSSSSTVSPIIYTWFTPRQHLKGTALKMWEHQNRFWFRFSYKNIHLLDVQIIVFADSQARAVEKLRNKKITLCIDLLQTGHKDEFKHQAGCELIY